MEPPGLEPHVLSHQRQKPMQVPSVEHLRSAAGQFDVLLRHRPRSISRPRRRIGNRAGRARVRVPDEVRVNAQHARFRLRDSRVSNDSACSSVSREPEKRGTGSRRGCPPGVQGHSRRSLHLSRGGRGYLASGLFGEMLDLDVRTRIERGGRSVLPANDERGSTVVAVDFKDLPVLLGLRPDGGPPPPADRPEPPEFYRVSPQSWMASFSLSAQP